MARRKKQRKEKQKTKAIAVERITLLLEKADAIYHDDVKLALNYGARARKIAMKAKISVPEKWRFRFCRNCKAFLYPGINSHVRIKAGKPSRVILYCEICETGFRAKAFKKKTPKIPQTKI